MLREWNFNIIFVQCIINRFLHLRHKCWFLVHQDPHGDNQIYATIAKVGEEYGYALFFIFRTC